VYTSITYGDGRCTVVADQMFYYTVTPGILRCTFSTGFFEQTNGVTLLTQHGKLRNYKLLQVQHEQQMLAATVVVR